MMPAPSAQRDLRLDLFRGLALWLIFLDHIPRNVLAWFTIRNYGFSDATEIFIFISGYTAAFVYGRAMTDHGFLIAAARIWRRAWQIYVAHVFLFAIFMAEVSYVAASLDSPLYAEEMNVLDFMRNPDIVIVQALLLKFRPVNMDVLPLYIVLLGLFPPVLWLLQRKANLALAFSLVLYVATLRFDLAIAAYPEGVWFFNPFAWQLLFVFGGWCALGGVAQFASIIRSRTLFALAALYLVFGFYVTLTWHLPELRGLVPKAVEHWMYPINKTNLDMIRLAHFLALALVVIRFVRIDWPFLRTGLARPAIICGQHSLEIFCLGVFLAFVAHFVLAEFSSGAAMQILVSLAGLGLMWGAAELLAWYKRMDRTPPPKAPRAGTR